MERYRDNSDANSRKNRKSLKDGNIPFQSKQPSQEDDKWHIAQLVEAIEKRLRLLPPSDRSSTKAKRGEGDQNPQQQATRAYTSLKMIHEAITRIADITPLSDRQYNYCIRDFDNPEQRMKIPIEELNTAYRSIRAILTMIKTIEPKFSGDSIDTFVQKQIAILEYKKGLKGSHGYQQYKEANLFSEKIKANKNVIDNKEQLMLRLKKINLWRVEINYSDENSYPVHSQKGEIYHWAIGDGSPSLPYAFAGISEPPRLYFTNDRQDPRYQNDKAYWLMRHSNQIRNTDTDRFSLPPHQEVLQIRQLLLAVRNVAQQCARYEGFFKSRQKDFAKLQGSNDWEKLTTCWNQLKASHVAAHQCLASEEPSSANLGEQHYKLIQSWKAMENASLPFILQDGIRFTRGRRTWVQDYLNSHQAFLTKLNGSSSGAEVCRQVHEKLKQFNNAIGEAENIFTIKTRIYDDLSEAHKNLNKSWTLLKKAVLPLDLHIAVNAGQEQYALASILEKGSSDLIVDHQYLETHLQRLKDSISKAMGYFADRKADPRKLQTMVDQLCSYQNDVKSVLPQIALQVALERYAQAEIRQIKEGSSDWIESRITSIQRKMQLLGPIQRVLPILATTTLEPIQRGLSDQLVRRFVDCLDNATRILDNASTFLLGKNIYDSAEECFQDGGKKVYTVLPTIERELSGLQDQLEQTFSDKNLSSLQEQLNHILEAAKTHLSSELSDQTSKTIEAFHNAHQYWQSHEEEIAKRFSIDQYNHIKFTLYAISDKYSNESADLSILSQVTTGSNDSHAQITGRIKLSPQAEAVLSQIKQFNERDNDYPSLLQIQTQFLEHEKEKLPEFLSRATRLSADWQSHQAEIVKVFGAGAYEERKKILAFITTEITAEKYTSERMSLELANNISDHNKNIRDLEIKLAYMALRKKIAWLEKPEEPEKDRDRLVEIPIKLHQLFLDIMRSARSLDTWVGSDDPRMTPDVIEKIGQLLTKADFTLRPRDGGTEQGSEASIEQVWQDISRVIYNWDTYRERKGPQPPIYLRDLSLEQRRDRDLNLIDPSKIEITSLYQTEVCTSAKKVEMKKNVGKLLEALQKKLEKDLAPILENNPIFQDFPPKELWRLCIDWVFQREDPISSLHAMDYANTVFFEPYFLVGTMSGFGLTLAGLGKKLTPEYYQLLHHECIKNNSVIYENGQIEKIKQGFRYLMVGRGPEGPIFARVLIFGQIKKSPLGFKEVCQNYDNRYSGDPRYKEGHPVGKALSYEDPRQRPGIYQVTPFTEKECEAHAQCIFDKYYEEISQTRREIAEQYGQEEWNYDWVKNLPEKGKRKALGPVAHFYRDLELSHLFWDGNGRLHNFCLLNKLLLENGLSPVILNPTDPHLCHCGIEEIITAILEGQARFESYKQSGDGKTTIK